LLTPATIAAIALSPVFFTESNQIAVPLPLFKKYAPEISGDDDCALLGQQA
jgi:hypothetical protein